MKPTREREREERATSGARRIEKEVGRRNVFFCLLVRALTASRRKKKKKRKKTAEEKFFHEREKGEIRAT